MGYRSDVKIAFYLANPREARPEWFIALPFAGLKLWFEENYPVAVAKDWSAEIEYGDDFICVSYSDVKWYDDYEHVEAVKAASEKFDEAFGTNDQYPRAHWDFIRVGENVDDIKVDGNPYSSDRLRVSRQIIFD